MGETMTRRAGILLIASIGALLAACNNATPPAGNAAGSAAAAAPAVEPGAPGVAPRFEVDPFWPKPLPNHWILGSTIGVSVDERDHVWMIHRGSATLADKEKALETK